MTRNPTALSLPSIAYLELDWLASDEVSATWFATSDSKPVTATLTIECDGGYYYATGDAPKQVLAEVADAASQRYASDEERDDFDEDAAERRSGGYRHSDAWREP